MHRKFGGHPLFLMVWNTYSPNMHKRLNNGRSRGILHIVLRHGAVISAWNYLTRSCMGGQQFTTGRMLTRLAYMGPTDSTCMRTQHRRATCSEGVRYEEDNARQGRVYQTNHSSKRIDNPQNIGYAPSGPGSQGAPTIKLGCMASGLWLWHRICTCSWGEYLSKEPRLRMRG